MSVAVAQLLLGAIVTLVGLRERQAGGNELMLIGVASLALGGFSLLSADSAFRYAVLAIFVVLVAALIARTDRAALRRHATTLGLAAASVACIGLPSLLPGLGAGLEQALVIGVWGFAAAALVTAILTIARHGRATAR